MDDQIKQLAETLRKTGMAASVYESIEKAKSILNVKTQKDDPSQQNTLPQQNQQPMPNLDAEVKDDTTLNELMKEINVSPEDIEAQEQEKIENIQAEVNEIKEDIKEADDPQKIEEVKEEIFQVKEEIKEIEETKTEEPKKEEFAAEKKIDLTKIFGKK